MQLFLSLLIAFPTCWRHSLKFPAPISGNLYSKRYFPVMGDPTPVHRFKLCDRDTLGEGRG
jgi:hypothetical protein